MIKKHLVEGFFITTVDNIIFEVKGVVHPLGRTIAYPRYVPDSAGERQTVGGRRYTKLAATSERLEYLRLNAPWYLWRDPFRNREMVTVADEQIAYILDPVETLHHMCQLGKNLTDLQRATLDLVKEIVKSAHVPIMSLGITGSQLVGLANENSDIDLVVYGDKWAKRVYSYLKRERENILRLRKYNEQELRKHVMFRWKELDQFHHILQDLEAKKIFQGVFGGYDFFIRAVKNPQEVKTIYESEIVTCRREASIICDVIDDRNALFTPCEYLVYCEEDPELTRLISYRGRFCEHVQCSETVAARGQLETVLIDATGERYRQLVLGESPQDYLIPLP